MLFVVSFPLTYEHGLGKTNDLETQLWLLLNIADAWWIYYCESSHVSLDGSVLTGRRRRDHNCEPHPAYGC